MFTPPPSFTGENVQLDSQPPIDKIMRANGIEYFIECPGCGIKNIINIVDPILNLLEIVSSKP
jgi:hypothetical protein